MLILTRRVGETLIIGDKVIHITVLGVKGCQVRLGVQAPKNVPVHREEIYLRIQAEKSSKLEANSQTQQAGLGGDKLFEGDACSSTGLLGEQDVRPEE